MNENQNQHRHQREPRPKRKRVFLAVKELEVRKDLQQHDWMNTKKKGDNNAL